MASPLLLRFAQREFSSGPAFKSTLAFPALFFFFLIFFLNYFAWLVLGFAVGIFVCVGFGVFCPWRTARTRSCAPVESSK